MTIIYQLVSFLGLLGCLAQTAVVRAAEAAVNFDAPAIVVAEPINPDVVEWPTLGGDLVRLRVPLSTFQSPEFRGEISEYIVEIESPYQTIRVIDFWPKNEVYSDIEGNVNVESTKQADNNLNFQLSGAYEPLGRGSVQGDFHNKSNTQESYQRKPPMQILTSSGTIGRGYGVFFKFRPGPLPVMEGVRDVAILAEVPRGWRADMLQVTMRAVGSSAYSNRPQTVGETRLWMTTNREGDVAAGEQAKRYVTQERALRSLAASSQARVQDKSLPTFWHKLGASLEVIDPKIPNDYLQQIIFGSTNKYYDNATTNRLPVDLRVAILDYWDVRDSLVGLARNTAPAHTVHVTFNDLP